MDSLRIKEASRAQLARLARLYSRAGRKKFRQSVVEGPQSVREVLAFKSELVRDVYATEHALAAHEDIREYACVAQVWVHVLGDEGFRHLSGDAQGILAVIDTPEAVPVESVLDGASLALACVRAADPGNLGTLIRIADAAGACALILGPDSCEVYSPKVIRASAGSLFHVPVIAGIALEELVASAHSAGMQCLGADGGGGLSLADAVRGQSECDLSRPTLWVLGNEAHGFAGEDCTVLDGMVSIPIYGKAESLNMAVAGGILAYASALAQARG